MPEWYQILIRLRPSRGEVNPAMDTQRFITKAVEYSKQCDSDILRSFGVKIHPEGTYNAKTSLMLEPYEDTDTKGSANVMPERMMELVLAANEANLDVIVHVDADGTARGVVDAFEASRFEHQRTPVVLLNPVSELRHTPVNFLGSVSGF